MQAALQGFENSPKLEKANITLVRNLGSVLAKADQGGVSNSEIRGDVQRVLQGVGEVFREEDQELSTGARELADFLVETNDAEQSTALELARVVAKAKAFAKRETAESESEEEEDDGGLPLREQALRKIKRVEKKLKKQPDAARTKQHLKSVKQLRKLLSDPEAELSDDVISRLIGDAERIEENVRRFEEMAEEAQEKAPAVVVCMRNARAKFDEHADLKTDNKKLVRDLEKTVANAEKTGLKTADMREEARDVLERIEEVFRQKEKVLSNRAGALGAFLSATQDGEAESKAEFDKLAGGIASALKRESERGAPAASSSSDSEADEGELKQGQALRKINRLTKRLRGANDVERTEKHLEALEGLRRAVVDAGPSASPETIEQLFHDVELAEENCDRFFALGRAVMGRYQMLIGAFH